MKDARKRRQKAEREVTESHPDIDSVRTLVPTKQERLAGAGGFIKSIATQGNELIATSNEHWALSVYALEDVSVNERSNHASFSDLDLISEEVLALNEIRPHWYRIPVVSIFGNEDIDMDGVQLTKVLFITKDVIVCTQSVGFITTWCTRTAQRLSILTFRNVTFHNSVTKLSETEFVVGSGEGHLCFFSHNNGLQLKETKRIWKAHRSCITTAIVYGDTLVTGCRDWTAKVWNIPDKRLMTVLNHPARVRCVAVSDNYIVTTCGTLDWESKKEIRFYRNIDGFPIVRIFYGWGLFRPRFISHSIVTYLIVDEDRNIIVFFDIEQNRIIDQLKVAMDIVFDYEFLADGRIIVGGGGGGVLVVPPKHLRMLISSGNLDMSVRCPRKLRFRARAVIVGLVTLGTIFKFCRTVCINR